MEFLFLHYLLAWKALSYLVIFLAMFFEGDIFLFSAAFLAHQGFFEPFFLFFILWLSVLFGDSVWYWLGYQTTTRFLRFKRWADRVAAPFDGLLVNRTFRAIFISKFIYGIHHALLWRTGSLKIGYFKFLKIDLLASLFWVLIIGGFGYSAGHAFDLVKHYFKFAEFGLLIGALILFAILHLIARRSRKKMINERS